MKIELDNIEIAHISSLINERNNTIEKILNAIDDSDNYLKNCYEKEKKIMDEINRKLFRKE